MNNPRTINLFNTEPIIGTSPEARIDWQCSVLSLLCEMDKSEVVNALSDIIAEAAKRVQSSLIPIMDRLCGNTRPYISETYLKQVLLPFLVRTIDVTLELVPPTTVGIRPVVSKERLFHVIKQNFMTSEAGLLNLFEKEFQIDSKCISLDSFYSNIISNFEKLTYGQS